MPAHCAISTLLLTLTYFSVTAFGIDSSSICRQTVRSLDGSCTSTTDPAWGRTNTPQFSYFRHLDSSVPSGAHLPSARTVSNLLCAKNASQAGESNLSEFVTFFSQFLDHDIGVTPEDKSSSHDISVPKDDRVFSGVSSLTFHRSSFLPVRGRTMVHRPANANSAVIDLSVIYGSDEDRCEKLRSYKKGLLIHDAGDLLQVNTFGMKNAPRLTSDFWFSGDHRANEHPVLTSLHTIFSREHNRLAREIADTYPGWTDEKLFQAARAINIAQFQRIVWQEFYPAMTGERIGRYRGFSRKVNPGMSVIFSTAAFRVGHSMVNDHFKFQYSKSGDVKTIPLHQVFFRNSSLLRDAGIEAFFRPTFTETAQAVDLQMADGLRNVLFKGIHGQTALDLAANNIQRGRDHALPTFNTVRRRFFMDPANVFAHFTSDKSVQQALESAYGDVDKVELWPGLLAEQKGRGKPLGKTTVKLWRLEFNRMRNGDRFYYENGFGMFEKEFMKIRSAVAVKKDKIRMRHVLRRNSKLCADEVPKDIWHVGRRHPHRN